MSVQVLQRARTSASIVPDSPRTVLLTLAAAGGLWLVRLGLIWQGGQRFFPDEVRFDRGYYVFLSLQSQQMDIPHAALSLIAFTDHPLFGLVSLPAAAAQYLALTKLELPEQVALHIAASVLSLWSIGCIGAGGRVGPPVGVRGPAAVIGLLLMVLSNALLYFSRHLLPYDSALCLSLLAAWIGASARSSIKRSFLCGFVAGFAVATYSGYWAAALTAMLMHVAYGWRAPFEVARRLVGAAVGFVAPLGVVIAVGVRMHGSAFVTEGRAFLGSVTQGDFSEAWSLPWEYLWQAEHVLLIVWVLGIVVLLLQARDEALRQGLIFLLAGAAIYLMISLAGFARIFVVYGRTARQPVPFVCLAAGVGLGYIWQATTGRWRLIVPVVLAGVLVNTAQSYAAELTIVYPSTFLERIKPVEADLAWTVVGPETPTKTTDGRYVVLNAGYPHPVLRSREPPPGRVLAQAPHALEFLPYQYESWSRTERDILRSTDISMRLVDTAASP